MPARSGKSSAPFYSQLTRINQKWLVFIPIFLVNVVIIYLIFVYSPDAGADAFVKSSSRNYPIMSENEKNQLQNQFLSKARTKRINHKSKTTADIPIEKLAFTPLHIDNSDFQRLMPAPVFSETDNEWPPALDKNLDTIFITFPSLNDPDCNETIVSAFGNASNPDRLYFGIYEQNEPDSNLDCLDISGVNCPFHPICYRLWQISITRVSTKQAAGPIWGRHEADRLYRGQKFILITDSHTFFRPFWDEILLQLWRNTHNDYAIITHYPKPSDAMFNDLSRWNGIAPDTGRPYVLGHNPSFQKMVKFFPMSYHICGTIFESSVNRMPRNANGCYLQIRSDMIERNRPILVPFWAAGFSFSKAHLRDAVKWDPHTKYIFHGEEFHFSTRAWTRGYDFYSPPYDIIFHRYYDKGKTPRFNINDLVSDQATTIRDSAEKRINYLWSVLEERTPGESDKADLTDIDLYPLGTQRTLDQFWQFVGVNIHTQTFTVFKEERWSEGGLTRTPWNDLRKDPVLNPAGY